MKDKPFKSVQEQIEILESRNLVFLDKEIESYFHLIRKRIGEMADKS